MGNKRKLSMSSNMADNNPESIETTNILPKTQPNYNFEIRCGEYSWVVHRGNLCTKSRFFKALCDGSFEVGVDIQMCHLVANWVHFVGRNAWGGGTTG